MSAMMKYYEYLLKDRNISFDAANSHIICFPHTLYLAVTAMLDAVTSPTARSNVTAPFTSPYEEPFAIDQQTLAEALLRDPCAIACDNINTIRMSQIRCSEFLNIVEAGNKKGKRTAKSSNGQEEVVQLALVPLTYYMSKRPEVFKDRLSEAEWTVLEHISDVLELPFILQEQMSIQLAPMLVASLPAYESVISALESARSKPLYGYLRQMLDVGIKDMQSNYNGHHFSKLLILGIVVHPSLRMRWFERKWEYEQIEYAKDVIIEELSKHRRTAPLAPSSPRRHRNHCTTPKKFKLFGDLWDANETGSQQLAFTIEEELKDYCHPTQWPNPETKDIVQWWDSNSDRYPTLF
ncbi:hypothetical protein M422DRAFT_46410 [Sphaerobolus stellatus SS14]|uniref:HAT C-terminal dimerisation domain-containing protein n=1 Tax=Sphaerobolus stellatus (strain SS14) TaxID=990650 RepID=A0A0C9VT82_SPHS4|nr:hypothetical protein M422DRAFT_46410 [Sphaerobolus stellatus SS14]